MDLEIDAARRTPPRVLEIERTEQTGTRPPYTEYCLTLTASIPPLAADAAVRLESADRKPVSAHVVGGRGRKLRVVTTSPTSQLPPSGGRVVIDTVWLLERASGAGGRVRLDRSGSARWPSKVCSGVAAHRWTSAGITRRTLPLLPE